MYFKGQSTCLGHLYRAILLSPNPTGTMPSELTYLSSHLTLARCFIFLPERSDLLNANASQMHFLSADVLSEFRSHVSNRLLDFSTWMSNWNLKSDMSKSELQRTLLKHPSPPAAAPGSLIGSFVFSVAQTENLGVALEPSLSHSISKSMSSLRRFQLQCMSRI